MVINASTWLRPCRFDRTPLLKMDRSSVLTAIDPVYTVSGLHCFSIGSIQVSITQVNSAMAEPISPITLPPVKNAQQEGEWLYAALQQWLNDEFLPEAINTQIARQASQVYVRQRLEGETDVGALVVAILTEMQGFDFSKSFFSEFAIANAVSDLLLDSLGIDRCCGQSD